MNEEIEFVRGSGNVFNDIGLPDADVKQSKVLLASKIIGILDKRKLSTRQAAGITGVDQSEFVRLRRPDLKRFTIDRLITILNKLDQEVEVTFQVKSCPEKTAMQVNV